MNCLFLNRYNSFSIILCYMQNIVSQDLNSQFVTTGNYACCVFGLFYLAVLCPSVIGALVFLRPSMTVFLKSIIFNPCKNACMHTNIIKFIPRPIWGPSIKCILEFLRRVCSWQTKGRKMSV